VAAVAGACGALLLFSLFLIIYCRFCRKAPPPPPPQPKHHVSVSEFTTPGGLVDDEFMVAIDLDPEVHTNPVLLAKLEAELDRRRPAKPADEPPVLQQAVQPEMAEASQAEGSQTENSRVPMVRGARPGVAARQGGLARLAMSSGRAGVSDASR